MNIWRLFSISKSGVLLEMHYQFKMCVHSVQLCVGTETFMELFQSRGEVCFFCERGDKEEILSEIHVCQSREQPSHSLSQKLKALFHFWMTSVLFRRSTFTGSVKSPWQSFQSIPTLSGTSNNMLKTLKFFKVS